MNKSTNTGVIVFHCKCMAQIVGAPEDTLMSEKLLETSESNLKHEVFIENSKFDPAACIIAKDCPRCPMNFLTLIRVGVNLTTMYCCRNCGFQGGRDDYANEMAAKK
jgi:hypothetical protein